MNGFRVAAGYLRPFGHGASGLLGVLLFVWVSVASGQAIDGRITPNFKDADIVQVSEAVSAATGKNFIIDPRVRSQVTMLSSTSMSPAAFYEAFLAILQVHGYIAVPAGNIIKILPDANARQFPSIDLPDHVSATSDEIVTQVIDVKNVSAAQLVPILRPMIPQYGHLAAYPAGNILIISDRANNVNRMLRIIQRIDQVGDQDVEVVPLENASAADVIRVLNSLFQQAAAAEGGVALKVVADERSNTVLISGDQSQRLRIRALVAHLDTPLKSGGDTQVRYLLYADAEKVAPKLKEQITGIAATAAGGAASGGAPSGNSPQAQAEKGAMVWADSATNSLVVTAPPKVMRAIMEIVDKLDIRRAQVLVEAVIVEVNADKTSDIGVNWGAWSQGANGTQIPLVGFIEPVGGSSILDVASTVNGIANGSTTSSSSASSLNGTTLGLGKFTGTGINYGAMIKAVSGDANTNIIATPSAVTMDNQEAKLEVAQEVPFITGQYSSTAGTTGGGNGTVNPFTTVQRSEVGTILKVTPQIAAQGNSVVLKISIESSSVAPTSVSTVDITTNKRTVNTSVMVEDGGIVVLGGLISDSVTRDEQRVPFLGSLPVVGFLFKTRDYQRTRNNLMIFIRPKILRTSAQTVAETDEKYNFMLNEERKAAQPDLLKTLLGERPPVLPPLPAAVMPEAGHTEDPKSNTVKSPAVPHQFSNPDPSTSDASKPQAPPPQGSTADSPATTSSGPQENR
jgi:general secretion pathway protein D